MKKLAFITYDEEALLTDDDQLSVGPLKNLGYSVTPIIWDSNPSLLEFDGIILRSCWNYHLKHMAFVQWLQKLNTLPIPVLNPVDTCIWNLNKSYLLDLQNKGVKVPKTRFIRKNDSFEHNFSEFQDRIVIKPAISLNGHDTYLVSIEDKSEIKKHLDDLLRTRDVLLQEYLPEIKTNGEISLIFFNGNFSHAIRKMPSTNEFRIQREYGGTRHPFVPEMDLIMQASDMVTNVGQKLLSCRVDVVLRGTQAYLIELEIIDPMLFLGYSEGAPERFAQAIHESFISK